MLGLKNFQFYCLCLSQEVAVPYPCQFSFVVLFCGLETLSAKAYYIFLLERVQRIAKKFILNDYHSDYKTQLISLGLLPLSMVLELNDIIFFLKSLQSPSASFNILDYVSFCTSSTRSASKLQLTHALSAKNSSFHFYFNWLACLWNRLPAVHPNVSLSSAISQIKRFLWLHFTSNFNLSDPCSYHLNCMSLPQMSGNILQLQLSFLVLLKVYFLQQLS